MRALPPVLLDVTGLVLAMALPLAGLALRRYLLQRGGGAVDVSLRRRRSSHGRGWVLGVGRYQAESLAWYRAFSFAPRPRRSFLRAALSVERERRPRGPERLAMLADFVVLECRSGGEKVELAMSDSALTGFRAWLEAAPTRPPAAPR